MDYFAGEKEDRVQGSAIVGMLHVVCMSDLKLIECKLPVGVVTLLL